jgi:hypothetical protein
MGEDKPRDGNIQRQQKAEPDPRPSRLSQLAPPPLKYFLTYTPLRDSV